MPLFVELCCGSASVSLRAMSSTGKPPIGYQGGKRGYARAILAALGLKPGECRGWDFLWVDAGPWAEAWQVWRTADGRADTIARLRAWEHEDPRTLWERLRDAPVPGDLRERVAAWAVLQLWNFGRKPVYRDSSSWRNVSFNYSLAMCEQYNAEFFARTGRFRWQNKSLTIADLIGNLRVCIGNEHIEVNHAAVELQPVIPGAVVVFDPPYAGTTGYGCDLPRAAVLEVAERWRAAGCLVAVCEQEPLPLPGWHHVDLGRTDGIKRTFSRQQREVLTISREPMGQMGLALGCG